MSDRRSSVRPLPRPLLAGALGVLVACGPAEAASVRIFDDLAGAGRATARSLDELGVVGKSIPAAPPRPAGYVLRRFAREAEPSPAAVPPAPPAARAAGTALETGARTTDVDSPGAALLTVARRQRANADAAGLPRPTRAGILGFIDRAAARRRDDLSTRRLPDPETEAVVVAAWRKAAGFDESPAPLSLLGVRAKDLPSPKGPKYTRRFGWGAQGVAIAGIVSAVGYSMTSAKAEADAAEAKVRQLTVENGAAGRPVEVWITGTNGTPILQGVVEPGITGRYTFLTGTTVEFRRDGAPAGTPVTLTDDTPVHFD